MQSPYYPDAYPHNKVCEWIITQPDGYVVTLNFLSFDVEGGTCRFDYVEVSQPDVSDDSGPRNAKMRQSCRFEYAHLCLAGANL